MKNKAFFLACFAFVVPLAFADQGGFVNSGGSLSGGSPVANPAGTLTISGNNLTFLTADGTTSIHATFTTSSTVESCAGGGRGGHISCAYTFTGTFSGTLTVNALTQAINGSTYQVYGTTGIVSSGNTGYNSAYTPFYFTDGEGRILRSDDLSGTNLTAYGSLGSGVGQFYGVEGIAVDSAGRIYAADTGNDRIVRIDDISGTNWTSFGTSGSGQGQFSQPNSISIDPTGHIWVLDSGNGRLIRMDDMIGTNWTVVGTVGTGTGVGQFASFSAAPGFDSLGRIYVADTGNRRISRFDDLKFTNWITLSQSQPIGPYIYLFGAPTGVVTDPAGKIYILDGSEVIRVDDMTGTNWTGINTYTGANTMAIDSSGMIMLGGNEVQIVDSLGGVLTSHLSATLVNGVYLSLYGAAPLSLPSPRPAAVRLTTNALTYANQNINSTSASQAVTITNFGGSPLNVSSITANGGFVQTNNCPSSLIAASSCTVNVSSSPTVAGAASGTLTLSDNSGNMGSTQSVSLTGFATQPVALVVPGSLAFPPQVLKSTSAVQTVTVQNTGNGPLQVSAATAAPFAQSNNCAAAIAPGGGCTITVSVTPTATGSVTGVLTLTGNAGTQSVNLAGSGIGTAPAVSVSPTQLPFPPQLVGTKSSAFSVTVKNTGTTAVANKAPTITGDFSETTTCTTSIAAGKSCTVSVKFSPTATGVRTGVLTLNLASGTQTVSLVGTGSDGTLPAALTFNPAAVSFNNGYIVGDNPSQTVTVTNTSNASVGIASLTLTGDPSLTQSNKCPAVLAAGSTCTISIRFVPVTAGGFTSTLTVTEASGVPDVISVVGIASTSDN